MKRAIIYYSLTNNTRNAAERVAKLSGADVYRVETIKPMPSGKGQQMFLGGMKAIFGMCPKIKGLPENIALYDEIIIGTPIWAGKNAPAINTLLRNEEVREKIIAAFTLSGGGDNDKCVEVLMKQLPRLKFTVALADRNNQMAVQNETKLCAFVKEIQNGER